MRDTLRIEDTVPDLAPDYVMSPSGLILPEALAIQRRPVGIDLFCGCGGMSCGVIAAGFDVIAAVDYDINSAMTYMVNLGAYPCKFHFTEEDGEQRLNDALEKQFRRMKKADKRLLEYFPFHAGSGWIAHHEEAKGAHGCEHFWLGDIRKITGQEILEATGYKRGEVDCVFGGPPCQGFSRAGKRNVMDPRNSLVFEFARLVLEIHPKTIVMENVPAIADMVTPEGFNVMDEFCRILQDGGFGGMEALKRSLAASSGAGAAMRGSKPPRGCKATGEVDEPDQLDLFEEAV